MSDADDEDAEPDDAGDGEDDEDDKEGAASDDDDDDAVPEPAPKRRGRPVGSRNKAAGERAKEGAGKVADPKKAAAVKKEPRLVEKHVAVPLWRVGIVPTLLHVPHDVMRANIFRYVCACLRCVPVADEARVTQTFDMGRSSRV